jgi:hypothetical protein
MINIVKEIKINILNCVKFVIRAYKRSTMFAFTLALCIVLTLSMLHSGEFTGVRFVLLECSSVLFLTTCILYLFDLVAKIKELITRPKIIGQQITRVSVGIPKK